MNEALPFRLLDEADLETARLTLNQRIRTWIETWFADKPRAELQWQHDAEPAEVFGEGWHIHGTDVDRWVAYCMAPSAWRDIAAVLLGTNHGLPAKPTPLLGDLLEECLSDFVRSLHGVDDTDNLGILIPRLSAAVRQGYGSGMLIGHIGQDLPLIRLAIGGAVVADCIGTRTARPAQEPLTPRAAAIRGGRIHLEVVLGDAEIRLGDLAQMAVGDILRLPATHKEPIVARNSQGHTVFCGYLGTNGPTKAIQVLK